MYIHRAELKDEKVVKKIKRKTPHDHGSAAERAAARSSIIDTRHGNNKAEPRGQMNFSFFFFFCFEGRSQTPYRQRVVMGEADRDISFVSRRQDGVRYFFFFLSGGLALAT